MTRLDGANLSGAILAETDLDKADLTGATVCRGATDLSLGMQKMLAGHALWVESNGSSGERVSLSGEDLHGVDLAGAALSGAELKGCNLSGANLSKALLVLADLSDANLRDADLRGADFSGANMQRANMLAANLRRADLSTVELKSASGDTTGQGLADQLQRRHPDRCRRHRGQHEGHRAHRRRPHGHHRSHTRKERKAAHRAGLRACLPRRPAGRGMARRLVSCPRNS
ncbi:MAG: pentapeptide repeat-containing protein [Alphaproteobacteria bacterium]|nr:pentapeptide repeat-containing protein [Alphaproteobacteria bacterium]